MDCFFWFAGRKNLPGKHGQQSLIAALAERDEISKPLQ
jgi:hypothetical protein